MRKDLYNLAKKHKNYYSIYPSVLPKNIRNVYIQIFTDCNNCNERTTLPVRFCPFRNCYIFDIPKNKFPSYKKIMKFIFIINNKQVFDKKYEIVVFGDFCVNQVNFAKFDEKQKLLDKGFNQQFKSIFNNISDSDYSYTDSSDEDEKYRNDYQNKTLTEKICINKNPNLSLTNSTSMSTRSSIKGIAKIKPRLKSILKNARNYKKINSLKMAINLKRRVSFGSVKFSY